MRLFGAGAVAGMLPRCDDHSGAPSRGPGRLRARPGAPRAGRLEPGLHGFGPRGRRDALLYVPRAPGPDEPKPFAVALHGAGGTPERGIGPLLEHAEDRGLVVLAPKARGRTWDVILGGFGPDVEFVDRALERVFARTAIDPRRVAVEGFSDGASYALSLGLTNGDLFTHVIAFSPGFAVPGESVGSPRVFVSHGTDDNVLPIDRTSRRLVPRLESGGYDVRYEEFDGRHAVPPRIARAAVEWFLDDA
ncbi:MAG TPA: phospholipase [Actinomycetota bacterium]|nr:phospholipase [Actinomycetota bacterium]